MINAKIITCSKFLNDRMAVINLFDSQVLSISYPLTNDKLKHQLQLSIQTESFQSDSFGKYINMMRKIHLSCCLKISNSILDSNINNIKNLNEDYDFKEKRLNQIILGDASKNDLKNSLKKKKKNWNEYFKLSLKGKIIV